MADRKRNWDKTPEAAEYRREFNRQTYDRIQIMAPKGTAEILEEAAKAAGMSKAAFVVAAILEKSAQVTKQPKDL